MCGGRLSFSIRDVPIHPRLEGSHVQRLDDPLREGRTGRHLALRRPEHAVAAPAERDAAPSRSTGGGRWDASHMATRVTSSRFVGRGAELAELEAALTDATDGHP